MQYPNLEIRDAGDKGRGVFATRAISYGSLIVPIEGWLARSDALDENWMALQVGADLWLCSDGESLDDCINHSCDPNAGFATGEPALCALRDIAAGEEIAWHYSTSLSENGWTLDCCCGSSKCRGVVPSWWELEDGERERLRSFALAYLR